MTTLNNNGFALWGGVIVGLLAITGIGLLVCKKQKRTLRDKKKKNQHKSQSEFPVYVVERLKPDVARFKGNFGALLRISTDNNEDTGYDDMIFQNIADVVSVRCDEHVKTWFSKFTEDRTAWDAALYKDKATILIKLFVSCGVTKCEETMDRWSNKFSMRYNSIVPIGDGTPCKIATPCWMLNGIVIEKGMVMAAK